MKKCIKQILLILSTCFAAVLLMPSKAYAARLDPAVVKSVSAILEGKVTLNYYVTLPDSVLADPDAYAVLSTYDKAFEIVQKVCDADVSYLDGCDRYRFHADFTPDEFNEIVTLRLYYGDDSLVTLLGSTGADYTDTGYQYSVMRYCNERIANSKDPKMVSLANAMIAYGTSASIEWDDPYSTSDNDTLANAIDADEVIDGYRMTESGDKPEGFSGAELYYFVFTGGMFVFNPSFMSGYSRYDYSYTIDGVPTSLNEHDYLSIDDIAAKDFDKEHVFTVSDGHKTYTMKCSVLSCAAQMCEDDRVASVNLGKSLYYYCMAAKAYFYGDDIYEPGKTVVSSEFVPVENFGVHPGDGVDDTEGINKAIVRASGNYDKGKTNTVYLQAGVYNIDTSGISLKSNVNLVLDKDAVLEVTATDRSSYDVINGQRVNNVTIQGGSLVGERDKHIGTSGEYGHGIGLYGCDNITISDMKISNNWGDGIYVTSKKVKQSDGSQRFFQCTNITVKNCTIFNNRRNNISLIEVNTMLIEGCNIYGAHGASPNTGVYIEPNWDSTRSVDETICRNVRLVNSAISSYDSNSWEYWSFMSHFNPSNPGYVTVDGIEFNNCVFNGWFGNFSGTHNKYVNNTFNGTVDSDNSW